MVINLIIWFIFGLTIAYILVIGIITYGWFRLSDVNTHRTNNDEVSISVLIAVRNEADNIGRLLEQILDQDYDKELFEIIVVDDHSSDDTAELVNAVIASSKQRIKLIKAKGQGKKSAIREGIATSTAKLIVTTDGDCEVTKSWLSGIIHYYKCTGKKVICGPVVYDDQSSLFKKMVTLDFASLIASGAGSLGAGLPLMGNGANLAFERDVFSNFKDNSDSYASGDDVFLIFHAARKYGSHSIGFLKNEETIVRTPPPSGTTDFIKQRIRWASKAKGYRMLWPMIVSLVVFFFNSVLFLILLGSIFYNWLLPIYFLLITTKLLIDIPLVYRFLSFSNKAKLKPYFLLTELFYPVYIVLAGVLSLFIKFEWKGRSKLR